jgi:hypothetical protein
MPHLLCSISPSNKVAYWPGQTYWTGGAKVRDLSKINRATHVLFRFQTPSIVSYKAGAVKACGAEAAEDFEESEESAAYWFKVIVIPLYQTPHFDDEI